MTTLSISRAWTETAEILKRDAGPLFIIAFALVALPQVILTALAPTTPDAEPSGGTVALMLVTVVAILVLSIAGASGWWGAPSRLACAASCRCSARRCWWG
jgi:hypothetical protein